MTATLSSSEVTELKPERIAGGDPFLRLLSGIKISPILFGVVFSVVHVSIRGLVAWNTGHLRTTGTITGFFDDPGVYMHLIVVAVILAYYAWMPRGIVTVFKGLYDNKVIGAPIRTGKYEGTKCYASFIEEMQASFGRRWWSAVSLAIAVGAAFILYLPRFPVLGNVWWAVGIPNQIFALLEVLINVYCVILLLIYSALSIYWLRRLFHSFTIYVRPLYPDRAGGLSPLGNFTLRLSYIIAVIGIALVITAIIRNYTSEGLLQFRWTTELWVGLGVYIVAAPAVFFAPLWVAHDAMQEAKEQLLLQIAQRFEREYTDIQEALGGDISGLKNSLEILGELQTLHNTTSKFPVWPFNVANVTRFVTTYVLPMALPVVTNWLGKIASP